MAAVRRAGTNIPRKREAREWDEQHGKLLDLSAFQRDILPTIRGMTPEAIEVSSRLPRVRE